MFVVYNGFKLTVENREKKIIESEMNVTKSKCFDEKIE